MPVGSRMRDQWFSSLLVLPVLPLLLYDCYDYCCYCCYYCCYLFRSPNTHKILGVARVFQSGRSTLPHLFRVSSMGSHGRELLHFGCVNQADVSLGSSSRGLGFHSRLTCGTRP